MLYVVQLESLPESEHSFDLIIIRSNAAEQSKDPSANCLTVVIALCAADQKWTSALKAQRQQMFEIIRMNECHYCTAEENGGFELHH